MDRLEALEKLGVLDIVTLYVAQAKHGNGKYLVDSAIKILIYEYGLDSLFIFGCTAEGKEFWEDINNQYKFMTE